MQSAEIVIALAGLQPLVVQQPGLSHEECLHLKIRVAVFPDVRGLDGEGPLLESISIGAETKIAGQGDEEGSFPIAPGALQIVFDALHLRFEPFHRQPAHPAVDGQGCYLGNDAITGRIGFLGPQLAVVGHQLRRHLQGDLGRQLAVGGTCRRIDHPHHMEYHVVVSGVVLMPVAEPVGGQLVNFHVAGPQHAVYPHLGIEKVRPGVDEVVYAGIDHFDARPLVAEEGRLAVEAVLPYVMEHVFHLFFHIGETDKGRASSLNFQGCLPLSFLCFTDRTDGAMLANQLKRATEQGA